MSKKPLSRTKWHWLVGNRYGGADGSSMGKMFRNRETLSDTALLAREAIQNSWDAARGLRKMLDRDVPFSVRFRYVDYHGSRRLELIEALGLQELSQRRSYIDSLTLPPGNILDNLDNATVPLRVLYVEDWGSHGLYGHPDLWDDSHLFLAMYILGGSKKLDGGGSYGFGKSALERASRIRSVIAHSAFRPYGDDPVTSRMVGFTWWGNHTVDGSKFEGRAMYAFANQEDGPGAGEMFDPYEDGASNELALTLGMSERDPSDNAQLGTSFMVVDPSIGANELVEELEKWWWPALEDHLFDISVVDEMGEVHHPKPAENPFVAPFIPAYHIATGQSVVSDVKKQRLASDKWRSVRDKGVAPGSLGLVVLEETNPEKQLDSGDSKPIVALIREPRMVIQYKSYERRRVALRGVYVASPELDPYLRETEPSSHDCWDTNPSNDVDPEATEMAKSVFSRISDAVKSMILEIAPPAPQNNKSLSHFSSLLSGFLNDKKGTPPPPPPQGEPIELQMPGGHLPEVSGPGEVFLNTKFTVRLADRAPADTVQVEVSCAAFINEEESQGGTRWPARISPSGKKHGFTMNADGSWIGDISKADKVTFTVETDPYSSMWTATLAPAVKRLAEWGN